MPGNFPKVTQLANGGAGFKATASYLFPSCLCVSLPLSVGPQGYHLTGLIHLCSSKTQHTAGALVICG